MNRFVAFLLPVVLALSVRAQPVALPWGADPPIAPVRARAEAVARLGRLIFMDAGMSASGSVSCATCHDPAHAFGPSNDSPVQFAGPRSNQPGTRAVPSLRYAQQTPFFTEHFHESDEDGDEGIDQGPTGGRTWDGRVDRPRDQAAIPLLAPNEMANRSEADVARRAAAAPWAGDLRRLFGDSVLDRPDTALAAIGQALEAYQEAPAEFSPFSSKYDAYLRGQAQLTAQEHRGLRAFNDPAKGNCNHCHKSEVNASGNPPLFTDYGFVAIGVPRNPAIPANQDPEHYDLGLCGPYRTDLADRAEYCGMFKAPTLRNVALRQSFYHNGVFHRLEDAVAFYATRDTNPERWYPSSPDGKVRKFDDLPERYHGNIDVEPPFDRKRGDAPALSPEDIADIVAFLKTLTDGFR